jgi:hypothetical protein
MQDKTGQDKSYSLGPIKCTFFNFFCWDWEKSF